jgi:cytochrome P450
MKETMDAYPSTEQAARRATIALKDLPGPRGIPILGNAAQLRPEQMHRQLEDWSQLHGKRYRIRLGRRALLVCADPDDIAAVLKDRPNGFRRSSRLEMVGRELQMAGVFGANGEDWRRQRAFVMHAFNPAHVKSYFPSLQTVASRLLKRWADLAAEPASFALEPELMRYTVDVTAGLAFGTDINTIESGGSVIQGHLGNIFRMLQKRLFAPFPYWHWLKRAEDRALDDSVKAVNQAVQEFVDLAHARMERDPALFRHPTNLLEAMIAAQNENASSVSELELKGNVLTMLLAGEDTTAHTLGWLIYQLSRHPDVFRRMRDEVDMIIGKDALPVRHEQLSSMAFMEACINESMRLRPVAPLIGAEAINDTTVADVTVPRGTVILMLTRAAAMEDRNFTDAAAFRPDRWLMPASEGNNKKVSIPFGAGPRLCPGRFLAIEEMKMALSMLAKNFDIESVDTPDGQPPRERLTFTMAPAGLRLKLRARQERTAA